MDQEKIIKELVSKNSLNKIVYFDEIDSTNNFAKENNLEDNTLIVANYQTKGRGRFNRKWESERNANLTFTLIKKIILEKNEIYLINFYVSYILLITLKEIFNDEESLNFSLKWPNDVLLNNKKLAGILTEIKANFFIIGIGINVNQMEFSDVISFKTTSLKVELKKNINKENILIKFIHNFYNKIEYLFHQKSIITLWKENCNSINKNVKFLINDSDSFVEGKIIDLDFDGGIVIQNENFQRRKFFSGEIQIKY